MTVELEIRVKQGFPHLYLWGDKKEIKEITEKLKLNPALIYRNQDHLFVLISRMFFKNHGELYELLGIDGTKLGLHSQDSDFTLSCDGFKEFILDYLNYKLIAKMERIYAELLSSKLGMKIVCRDGSIFYESEPIVLYHGKLYKLKLIKTDDTEYRNYVEMVKMNYEMQMEVLKKIHRFEIQKLTQKIDEIKNNAFIEGLKVIGEYAKDWMINRRTMTYTKTIYVKGIQYKGKVYPLPSGMSRKYYIKNLRIPIDIRIHVARCSEAKHPNVDEDNKVCLGKLAGKEISYVLQHIINSLQIANLDDAFPVPAKTDLEKWIVEQLEKQEEEEVETRTRRRRRRPTPPNQEVLWEVD